MAEYKRWKFFDRLFDRRKKPTTYNDGLDDVLSGGFDPANPLILELSTARSMEEIKAEVRAHLEENEQKLKSLPINVAQPEYKNITKEEWAANRLKLREELAARKGPRTVRKSGDRMKEWLETEEGQRWATQPWRKENS